MPKIPLPILFSPSTDATALPDMVGARLVNGYVDKIGDIPSIHKAPGLELICNLGVTYAIDGLFWWDALSCAFAVCNGRIYRLHDPYGTFTDITGDALSIVAKATFATNGTYGFFASGGRMVTSLSGAATAFVADADAPTEVSHVAYMDRYIFANKLNTALFYWCDVNSPLAWTSTSFGNPESKPDYLNALHVGNREITLFGRESLEFWFNDGINPFSRIEGTSLDKGCIAPHSIVNAGGGAWIFLDDQRRVVVVEGRSPRIVSGPYDNIIRDFYPVTDAVANLISIGKQTFYILDFPTMQRTFVWNITSDTWSEWGDWDNASIRFESWKGRSSCYCRAWDCTLVGDHVTGKIYKIRPDVFNNNSEVIRTIISPGTVTHGTMKRKRADELILRVKRGLGSVAGSDPVFVLRWKNEDQVWQPERTISLGKIGDVNIIKKIQRCGVYRTRDYEFEHTEDTDFVLSDMEEIGEVLEDA